MSALCLSGIIFMLTWGTSIAGPSLLATGRNNSVRNAGVDSTARERAADDLCL